MVARKTDSMVNLPPISNAAGKGALSSNSRHKGVVETMATATNESKAVCTCGKCHCRKHHCQVHHIGTNTLMMDPKLRTTYNPTSDYKDTFHPIEDVAVTKRGLAVPAQILPDLNPSRPMDILTMSRKDYVEKPLVRTNALTKPKGSIPGSSGATFQDTTSYKLDYPRRKFDMNPMSESLMRTTLPRIIEVGPEDNYCTTNQYQLKKWSDKCRPEACKELQEKPFFVGKFQTESLMRKDFTSMRDGKPRKSCKKIETHLAPGKFDGKTTHKMMYQLPPITQNRVVFAKNKSKGQLETMLPNQNGVNFSTQYQKDTSAFPKCPLRRGFCLPEPDKLMLFNGAFNHETVHKSSYVEQDEIPRPRTSFKNSQLVSTNPMEGADGKFYDDTTTNLHYQPVPCHIQATGVKYARDINFKASQDSKGSQQVKESQDFGIGFHDKTVNQSDYFQFWKVPPRKLHADKAERVYYPSTSKFDSKSETKENYVMKECKPAEAVKPLDTRFRKSFPLYGRKVAAESCYKSDYVPLPLPKPEMCPAEQLLKQA